MGYLNFTNNNCRFLVNHNTSACGKFYLIWMNYQNAYDSKVVVNVAYGSLDPARPITRQTKKTYYGRASSDLEKDLNKILREKIRGGYASVNLDTVLYQDERQKLSEIAADPLTFPSFMNIEHPGISREDFRDALQRLVDKWHNTRQWAYTCADELQEVLSRYPEAK